jgi:hypothetical protein
MREKQRLNPYSDWKSIYDQKYQHYKIQIQRFVQK